jgi:uncharacterized protein
MFGISFQKLLVLVAVIAVVWYGFKFIGRLQDRREADRELRASGAGQPKTRGRGAERSAAPEAEDMVECPVCQAYVPARGASRCERADCPY